jgi:hypothetical protein
MLQQPSPCRIAAVTATMTSSIVFDFQTYLNASSISDALLSLPYIGGSLRLQPALSLVQILLTPAHGYRGGRAVVVYVTNDVNIDAPLVTATAVNALRNAGGEVYVVGVGDQVSPPELKVIASSPTATHVNLIDSFDVLATDKFKTQFLSNICDTPVTTTTTTSTTTTSTSTTTMSSCNSQDFVFMLDGASTLTTADWSNLQTFVANIIGHISIGPSRFAISMMIYEVISMRTTAVASVAV